MRGDQTKTERGREGAAARGKTWACCGVGCLWVKVSRWCRKQARVLPAHVNFVKCQLPACTRHPLTSILHSLHPPCEKTTMENEKSYKVQDNTHRHTHRQSVVTPVSSENTCEKSYLKMATDGAAGIRWLWRKGTFGLMPTRRSWSLCAFVCMWVYTTLFICVQRCEQGPSSFLCASVVLQGGQIEIRTKIWEKVSSCSLKTHIFVKRADVIGSTFRTSSVDN